MRSLREIKTSISHAKVGAKPEADRTVLRHLLAEFESAPGAASASTGRREWRTVTKSRSLKAVAAAALVALALIVARRPHETTPPAAADRIPAAADLLTAGYLNAACRRGGLEAMNRQCEEAARRLDNRPERVSAEDLIRELNEIQASKG